MGVIHRFTGKDGEWNWEGVPLETCVGGVEGMTGRRYITRRDGAYNCEVRYFELAPGVHSNKECHVHDHYVTILRGHGTVLLGEEEFPVQFGDAIYIPPHEVHQLRAAEDELLGFQ